MPESRPRIAVTPPAFCKSTVLRNSLTEKFPGSVFNDQDRYLDEDELVRFLQDADGALIGRDRIGDSVLERLPNLKIIAKYGVGLDNVDEPALKRHGVQLGWTPGVNRESVAELTVCFILGLFHNIFATGFSLKNGQWNKQGGRLLREKTIGIVGCGNVGQEVVRMLAPYRCDVLICDLLDKSEFCQATGARQVSFAELLQCSDLVSLHVPLTHLTQNMIDWKSLRQMKPGAFLINTSRGEVVDLPALKAVLKAGTLAGAALDVFYPEPPEDAELLALENLMATPHIGGNALEAVEAMGQAAIDHLQHFFHGGEEAGETPKERDRNGYGLVDWQKHYHEADYPWDLAEPAPPFVRLFESGEMGHSGEILIPGCGRGHEVVYLAQNGFRVTGVDFVREAVDLLGAAIRSRNLNARAIHSDFFALDASHFGQYDCMIEHTFFCAIDPERREPYVTMAEKLLKNGGRLIGLFYETGEEGGPPWNTTAEQIRELFSGAFEIERLEKCRHSIERRKDKEWLGVFVKKRSNR